MGLQELIEKKNRQTSGAVRKVFARTASDEQVMVKLIEAGNRVLDSQPETAERKEAEREMRTVISIAERRTR